MKESKVKQALRIIAVILISAVMLPLTLAVIVAIICIISLSILLFIPLDDSDHYNDAE